MRRLSYNWLARFRRRRRALAVGVALPTIALVAGITALAYWTTTGSGDASASVGTLDSTTITMHEATGTSVALAWDAVVPPDPDAVEYYVLRDDASTGGSCGTAASPIASLTCTDTVPASSTPMSYSYEVVAVWRSWTSESDAVDVDVKASQSIVFTSTAPSGAKVGGSTYEVAATGGGSGNPVTFTIDASASSVCSIAGSTVSFTAVGTCTVNANQAGNASYEPAAQAQQSFAVAEGDQAIVFTSTAPSGAKVGGSTYEVAATGGGSGNPVTFTIDPSASSVCSIAGSTVSFTAVGTCKVSANQSGNANYEPAAQAQQSFAVAKGDQTISFGGLADKRFDESPITVGATATSGLAVAFSSATPAVCSVSGTGVSFVSVGICTVNANQAGSSNWNAAPLVPQSFQVTKGNQVISFAALADKRFDESPVTVGATATSGLAVAFSSATPAVCSVSGTGVSFVSVGVCTVNANQAGSSNWNAAPLVPAVLPGHEGQPGDLVCGLGRQAARREPDGGGDRELRSDGELHVGDSGVSAP